MRPMATSEVTAYVVGRADALICFAPLRNRTGLLTHPHRHTHVELQTWRASGRDTIGVTRRRVLAARLGPLFAAIGAEVARRIASPSPQLDNRTGPHRATYVQCSAASDDVAPPSSVPFTPQISDVRKSCVPGIAVQK